MRFTEQLTYFAFGCAFVVAAQVLSVAIASKGTSHQEAKSVEFDTLTVRSLRIVDASGRIYALLEKTTRSDELDDVVQVFNPSGKSVFRIAVLPDGGAVSVWGNDGGVRAVMGSDTNGGHVAVLSRRYGAGVTLRTGAKRQPAEVLYSDFFGEIVASAPSPGYEEAERVGATEFENGTDFVTTASMSSDGVVRVGGGGPQDFDETTITGGSVRVSAEFGYRGPNADQTYAPRVEMKILGEDRGGLEAYDRDGQSIGVVP